MISLTLYHTSGCHLCEEAESMISNALAALGLPGETLERADIAEDIKLMDRYGLTIPVLRDESNDRELGWPFGSDEVLDFIGGCFQDSDITEKVV